MQESLAAMKAALRVLAAVNEKRQPEDADLKALTGFAGRLPEDMDLDEFACDVILKALGRRTEVRHRAGSAVG